MSPVQRSVMEFGESDVLLYKYYNNTITYKPLAKWERNQKERNA